MAQVLEEVFEVFLEPLLVVGGQLELDLGKELAEDEPHLLVLEWTASAGAGSQGLQLDLLLEVVDQVRVAEDHHDGEDQVRYGVGQVVAELDLAAELDELAQEVLHDGLQVLQLELRHLLLGVW